MYSEVWWPDSVMNDSLSIIPFLEVISSVLLVSWVDLRSEDHFVHELSLLKTLINQEIIFLMHGAMATLARSLEDLKSTSQAIYYES
jgi:hypothetical protein